MQRHYVRRYRRSPIGVLTAVLALLAIYFSPYAHASSPIVTTSNGVQTHGSITTTPDTVGWLLKCKQSHRLAEDPITAPGVANGAHLHDFTGNATTNRNSTVASMEASSNLVVNEDWNGSAVEPGTSCAKATYSPGTVGDTAAYWRPVLYRDGLPMDVTLGGDDQLYYRAKTLTSGSFVPIPQDARLIVGDHTATSVATNYALANGYMYWECNDTTVHYTIPPAACDGMLLNAVFPQCWNGHVMDHAGPRGTDNIYFAYPTNGVCPAAFPQQIAQLSEKFKYEPGTASHTWALSADPGSSTLEPMWTIHVDFWNTWRPAALSYLTTKCLNARISCGTNPITPTS